MNNDLIGELLQGLTDDIASVKKTLATQPPPIDYSPTLEKLTASMLALRAVVAKAATPVAAVPVEVAPAVDTKALEQQVRRTIAEEVRRYHPDRPLTQTVRYGIWVFIGVLGLLCLSWFGWWNAAQARDRYVRSNWFWRYTQQTNRAYTTDKLKQWQQDSVGFQQAVEQAEATEMLQVQAQRKRAEAAALEAQAARSKKRK